MSYYNQQQGGYGGQPPYQQPPPQGYQQPNMQNQQYPPQGGYPPQQQNQGWGAPPSGQFQHNYGPPQGPPPPQGQYQPPVGQYQQPGYGYGQPQGPPPGQYGQGYPPQGQQPQWGPPPPQQQQNQWGQQPPQQGQFGAPGAPPGQYNAPPPGQTPYGAPAPGAGFAGPATQASLGYGPQKTANIDVSRDIELLRKAMKGFGTDEKVLITTLSKKDPLQMETIRTQYDQRLVRNLLSDLDKETSGYFQKGLLEIGRGPLVSDCYNLMEAMKGMGTKEVVLDDVLIGRSNADVTAIKQKYQELFKRTLEADLRGDLSAGTEQMYMMIIAARRNEDSHPVNPQEIEQWVTELQNSIGGFVGKNATQACQLLTSKNDAQLKAISEAYYRRFQKDLDGALKSAFSGHMEDALRLLVSRAVNRAAAEAVRLEDSMAGLGTKDQLLVQRVVRCHWNQQFMNAVSAEYKRIYKKDLVKRIEGETRGDYEKLMVACVK